MLFIAYCTIVSECSYIMPVSLTSHTMKPIQTDEDVECWEDCVYGRNSWRVGFIILASVVSISIIVFFIWWFLFRQKS